MDKINNFWEHNKIKSGIIITSTSVFLFLIIAVVLMGFKINPWIFYKKIFLAPFSNINNIHNWLNWFSYLLLAALATFIAFKFRIYNLGVIGQMLMAAMTVFIVSKFLTKINITSKLVLILLIMLSMGVGAFYALIAGLFKTYLKINEMGTTIILNIIAINIYYQLPEWKYYEGGVIDNNASLIFQLTATFFFSIIIFLALLIFIFITALLDRKVFGFRLELTIINANVASYARLNPKAKQLLIMTLSGAIAGLAGYSFFVGNLDKVRALSPNLLIEWDGLLIVLWAFNSRVGIFLLSVLFAFFRLQLGFLSLTSFDNEIVEIIFSVCMIISVLASYLLFWNWKPKILLNLHMKNILTTASDNKKIPTEKK